MKSVKDLLGAFLLAHPAISGVAMWAVAAALGVYVGYISGRELYTFLRAKHGAVLSYGLSFVWYLLWSVSLSFFFSILLLAFFFNLGLQDNDWRRFSYYADPYLLPTLGLLLAAGLFIFFYRKRYAAFLQEGAVPLRYPLWRSIWFPFLVLLSTFLVSVILRIPAVSDKQKTAEAVTAIHAQKITLADVMGDTLIKIPDQAENDATVAGLDTNNNGIRDDVEIAIFKKYPNSAKIRAAELQYAMAEQMYLTKVFNKETWGQVAEEADRAFFCIMSLHPTSDYASYTFAKTYSKEVENLTFNTQSRRDAKDKAFDFTTSYGGTDKESCDIKLNTLVN